MIVSGPSDGYSGNTSKRPVVCCMLVHLFEATSSPTCPTMTLQRTSQDQNSCSVRHNFYVDSHMLKGGGGRFHLTKWCSNKRNVFQSIPLEERANELNVIQLEKEDLPNERALE